MHEKEERIRSEGNREKLGEKKREKRNPVLEKEKEKNGENNLPDSQAFVHINDAGKDCY